MYREQTIEITLGRKPYLKSGIKRRKKAAQNLSGGNSGKDKAIPPADPKTPKVVELIRQALDWQKRLDSGKAKNMADIARKEGLTRARITQIMALLNLSPEIQEQVLALPDTAERPPVTEHALRPITRLENHRKQMTQFRKLMKK